ncbi:MAG TPA: GNAT family N-acetyltransferase [Kofleriaceae bacterium]|nr:GNAT family N-acetyltransferase [Kofleriaceae bacterium]
MAIEIALLTPDDWAEFRAARLASLAEAPLAFGGRYEDERDHTEATWRARLAVRAQFVAREAGATVGMAGVFREGPHEAGELVSMWIAPSHRRRGVGRMLVERAIAHARAIGCGEMRLLVAEDNPEAERLYARCGFVRTGISGPIRPGEPRQRHEMARVL